MPILILALSIILKYKTNTHFSVSITATAISFSLSYSLFVLSSLIITVLTLPFSDTFIHFFGQLFCFFLQLLIMRIPFSFKRTRHGMPFLRKQLYAIPGMIISLFIILSSIFLNDGEYNPIYYIPCLILFTFAILIFIYWRNYITKTYIDKLNIKNIESLNAELLEKQQYIEKLENDNAQLAKIVHKDNKMIPAMEYAVETFINEASLENEKLNLGNELLDNLREISKNRKGIITTLDKQCDKLPSCGVSNIQHLLQYIQKKASESNITFHVTLDCSLSDFIDNVIQEDDLYTLLADLLENAIIATRYNNGKHILLNIGMLAKHYSLHIFDCGIPFTTNVLANLGEVQITTHPEASGSGVGLMQTYEILRRYNASLLIDEFSLESGLYTKKISVVFNRQNQYILYTTRNEEEIALLNQRADLVVVRK
jgi:hypothetical protein